MAIFSGGCSKNPGSSVTAPRRDYVYTATPPGHIGARQRCRRCAQYRHRRRHDSVELYGCPWLAGSNAEPVYEAERPGELGRSVLDPELAAATLGFRSEMPLAAGVAATWEWMQA